MRGSLFRLLVLASIASLSGAVCASAWAACSGHPWCNARLTPRARGSLVVAAMSQGEKLSLVASGLDGAPRLGIPPLRGVDGPNGIGEGHAGVTAFPDGEAIAASWNPRLAHSYGVALGSEAAGKGFDWIWAPTINIVRTPRWGREAETLGEDPFLTSSLVAPEIQGLQSQHVIAEVKHYIGNNQEVDRFGQPVGAAAVSDRVSERALNEIYLPGFRAAVQRGHVGAVMCSYNRVNGQYSCQDPQTLGILKRFGLQGFVGPDAELAVRDDVAAANAGVDNLQLGSLAVATGGNELTILTDAVRSGGISSARLDEMARRVLTAMFAVGAVDHPPIGAPPGTVSTTSHRRLATSIAEQATVLLRNRGHALPLSRAVGSIAVIGKDAGVGTQIEENGSPAVAPGRVITPLAAIRSLVGSRSRIRYEPGTLGVVPLTDIPSSALTPAGGVGHGLTARYYQGQNPAGAPVLSRTDANVDFASAPTPLAPIPSTPDANSATWTGMLTPPATGWYRFSLKVSGAAQLFVGGRSIVRGNAEFFSAALPGGLVRSPGGPTITFQGVAHLIKGRAVPILVRYATASSIAGAALQLGWQPPRPSLLAAAVRAARHARAAIVFANDVTSEGMDRPSLSLPGDQDRLIAAVAAANPRTIVVLHTAGPVLMPWLGKVAGVVEAWYPGQQSGSAIAATLFGRADPSGRLPVTFPATASQGPATSPSEYPGVGDVADYAEGIFVGYRYYERFHQKPLFPFGFGLSYTRFSLGPVRVRRLGPRRFAVSVPVRNTGTRAGTDVVQLYVGDPPGVGEPPRQLKGFARASLRPGQSEDVTMRLDSSSFSYFDAGAHRWRVAPGRYRLGIGTSSADVREHASVVIGDPPQGRAPAVAGGFPELSQLPVLDPLTEAHQASSHAPDGSNVDFGHYLYRDSKGRYVLMQASGPGAITRIWMTHPDLAGDVSDIGRVEIFFDGESRPRVSLPASVFFAGRTAPFLAPLCGDENVSSGGNYCEVRMPFRTGVKVAVTGKPPYFDIGYETYPAGTPVSTFDPSNHATLGAAAARARLLRRAGSDPRILPGGPSHQGSGALAAGARRMVADIRGPGTIRAIELSISPHDDAALQNVWLQASWDGAAKPAVAAPLADLFLTGAGERGPAHGLLAGYLPGRHQGYLYFPMPFARRARIELVNRSDHRVTARWLIKTSRTRYPRVGSTVGELHASFAGDPATAFGTDFVALDAPGAGKVVGFSFTEEGRYNDILPVFMEGDERVYFDGSRSPQIYGTGTEDMFDGGYYYNRGPFTLPTHGATTKQNTPSGDGLISQYRLMVDDPWPFRDGIDLGIQHGAGDGLPTTVRSVVFWYGTGRPELKTTDSIAVAKRASAAAAKYKATKPDPPNTLTAFYEGNRNGNIPSLSNDLNFIGSLPPPPGTDPRHQSVTDTGRRHRPGALIRFRLTIDPRNDGVVLRRRLDQAVFGQRASVLVDGTRVGTWLTPGQNTTKRWADSDFVLPRAATRGKRRISVALRVLPPLGAPSGDSTGWSDFRYTALTLSFP